MAPRGTQTSGLGSTSVSLLDRPIRLDPALAFLRNMQARGGGWAYRPSGNPCVESTAAASLALGGRPDTNAATTEARVWLQRIQHADGGWGMNAEDGESGWHTAWAVLALSGRADSTQSANRGRDWLTAVPVADNTSAEMQAEVQRMLSIDFSLRGLPWLPNQASWVEPTALGLLALSRAPSTPPGDALLAEAVRYLADRRCAGGGWNFGNPVMLGAQLPPRAHMTAVTLLAFANVAPGQIKSGDVTALRRQIESEGGDLATAWGLLVLKTLHEPTGDLENRLAALQLDDGSWNHNPYHTAMALVANRGNLWADD